MSEIANGKKVILTNVLLCFPYLFEKNTYGTKPKWGAVFNLGVKPDAQQVAALKAAAQAAALEKWGDRAKQLPLKMPWRTGRDFMNKKTLQIPEGFHADDFCIRGTAEKQQPGVVDQRVNPIMDPKQIYAGCIVNAAVNAYAYDNEGMGISFGLQNVQLVRGCPNERAEKQLGGGVSRPQDDFKPLAGADGAGGADAGALFGGGDGGAATAGGGLFG